jgi:hypothetical protein
MIRRKVLLTLLAALTVTGCAYTPTTADQSDVDGLAEKIMLLGPDVDPEEARRAAEISHSYSRQLAREYNVTDLPIFHNNKVHSGERERGLCNHYAEDMTKRLKQEGFRTLEIQRAISPPTSLRIIHHTAVITRPGDTIYEGVVVDGWRHGTACLPMCPKCRQLVCTDQRRRHAVEALRQRNRPREKHHVGDALDRLRLDVVGEVLMNDEVLHTSSPAMSLPTESTWFATALKLPTIIAWATTGVRNMRKTVAGGAVMVTFGSHASSVAEGPSLTRAAHARAVALTCKN